MYVATLFIEGESQYLIPSKSFLQMQNSLKVMFIFRIIVELRKSHIKSIPYINYKIFFFLLSLFYWSGLWSFLGRWVALHVESVCECLLDHRRLILAALLALTRGSRPMNSCSNPEKQNTNSLKIFRLRVPESPKMDLRKIISQWGKEPWSPGSFSFSVRCERFSTC